MFKEIVLLLIISSLITNIYAKRRGRYVIANVPHLALYSRPDRVPNEKALSRVSQNVLLVILNEKGGAYKVSDSEGHKGWVKKWLVKEIISDKNLSDLMLTNKY